MSTASYFCFSWAALTTAWLRAQSSGVYGLVLDGPSLSSTSLTRGVREFTGHVGLRVHGLFV